MDVLEQKDEVRKVESGRVSSAPCSCPAETQGVFPFFRKAIQTKLSVEFQAICLNVVIGIRIRIRLNDSSGKKGRPSHGSADGESQPAGPSESRR